MHPKSFKKLFSNLKYFKERWRSSDWQEVDPRLIGRGGSDLITKEASVEEGRLVKRWAKGARSEMEGWESEMTLKEWVGQKEVGQNGRGLSLGEEHIEVRNDQDTSKGLRNSVRAKRIDVRVAETGKYMHWHTHFNFNLLCMRHNSSEDAVLRGSARLAL